MRPRSVCFPVGYRRVAPERPGKGNRSYKACGKFPANRVVARFDLRYTRGEQWEGMLIDYLKVRPIEYTGHQRSLLPTTEYLICSRASGSTPAGRAGALSLAVPPVVFSRAA